MKEGTLLGFSPSLARTRSLPRGEGKRAGGRFFAIGSMLVGDRQVLEHRVGGGYPDLLSELLLFLSPLWL